MNDGQCEVVAVPERGLVVLEPIVKQKTMTLIRNNKRQKVRVVTVRKRSKITIEPGKFVDFYI